MCNSELHLNCMMRQRRRGRAEREGGGGGGGGGEQPRGAVKLTSLSLAMPPEGEANLEMMPTSGKAPCSCLAKRITFAPTPLHAHFAYQDSVADGTDIDTGNFFFILMGCCADRDHSKYACS